jgi:hypothetical protein
MIPNPFKLTKSPLPNAQTNYTLASTSSVLPYDTACIVPSTISLCFCFFGYIILALQFVSLLFFALNLA